MTTFETTERFFRPDDVRLTRRNRRQLQAERLIALAGRLLFVLVLALVAYWIFQRAHQDRRFAIRSVELAGVRHTAPADLAKIKGTYSGRNLFKVDIEGVQRDLRKLPWIESVAIEKKLPSTLKITVSERKPVALAPINGSLRYVDQHGRAFAELSLAVGNPDLPLVNAPRGDLAACVQLLNTLKASRPELYTRVSEVAPAGENGFAIFDRDLKTTVLIDGPSAAGKWLLLYSIAGAEKYRSRPLEYVDLRFANRIIIKPVESRVSRPNGPEPVTANRGPQGDAG